MSGWVAGTTLAVGLYSASQAEGAAEDAARAQSESSEAAIAEQRRQFDLTRGDLAPWMQAGTSALGVQQNLLGLGGVEAQQQAYDDFVQSPGQAFLQARGQENLLAGASAIGGLGGGNVREALVQQGVGFAQQDFGDYYNRIAGLSGTGQTTANQLGAFGANTANQIGSNLRYGGEARASGILGAQEARAGFYEQIPGFVSQIPGLGT